MGSELCKICYKNIQSCYAEYFFAYLIKIWILNYCLAGSVFLVQGFRSKETVWTNTLFKIYNNKWNKFNQNTEWKLNTDKV